MAADTQQNMKKRGKGNNPNSLANLRPNPGGRPKQPKEFKELVKAHTVDALQTVIDIMQDKDAKPTDRLKASEMIMERAYGKAAQPIVGDKDHDAVQIDILDPEQRRALIEQYIARQGAQD